MSERVPVCVSCQQQLSDLNGEGKCWGCAGGISEEELAVEDEIRQQVYDELFNKEGGSRMEASEILSYHIKTTIPLYTIRSDDRTEIWVYRKGIYVPQGKTYILEVCRRILRKAYSPHFVNQIIAKIEADTYIESKKFFDQETPEELAVQNGILNIKTRELMEFSSDRIIFSKLPLEYNPKAECPNLFKFFNAILPTIEDIILLQEIFGDFLLQECRYEKANIFIGDGRNGKSKVIDVIKGFLGEENCCNIPIQQLNYESFNICELHGKRANLAGDIGKAELQDTATFKGLTGRDLITAKRKFLPGIHFRNSAKMVFSCNEIPRTNDNTIAFWERWNLMKFPFTFLPPSEYELKKEQELNGYKIADPKIIDKILTQEELNGLLNWALEGFDRLEEQNGFSKCHTTEEVRKIWQRKSDSFLAFMEDKLEEDENLEIIKRDLRSEYQKYCKQHKVSVSNAKQIKKSLEEELGIYESQGAAGLRVWKGIKWKS